MNLDYVVITSVDRDDLEDGGASHIANCVLAAKASSPKTTVEVLSPDFRGQTRDLDILLELECSVAAFFHRSLTSFPPPRTFTDSIPLIVSTKMDCFS